MDNINSTKVLGIGSEIDVIQHYTLDEIIAKVIEKNEWPEFISEGIPVKEACWCAYAPEKKLEEHTLMNSCILGSEGRFLLNRSLSKYKAFSALTPEFEVGLKLAIASHRIENLYLNLNYNVETFVQKAFDKSVWEWPIIIKNAAEIVKKPGKIDFKYVSVDDYIVSMVENACTHLHNSNALHEINKKSCEDEMKEHGKSRKDCEDEMKKNIKQLSQAVVASIKILIAAYNILNEFGIKNNKYNSALALFISDVDKFLNQ